MVAVEASPAHAASAEDPVPTLTAQPIRLADAALRIAPAMVVEDLGAGTKTALGVPELAKLLMNRIHEGGVRLSNLSPPSTLF